MAVHFPFDHAALGDEPAAARPRAARVLVVDDCEANVRMFSRVLTAAGHSVIVERTGEDALARIERDRPDLIVMDVVMPGIDGIDVCRELKRQPSTQLIPLVLVTALDQPEDKIRGLEAGADDFLSKPVHVPELRARVSSLLRIKRYTDDLESAESVMLTLALTVEARDAYTQGHCERLASAALRLGRTLGLCHDELSVLSRGAFMHDIGKIGVPDAVLLKCGPLTFGERETVKQHPLIGDRLCANMRSLQAVRTIVRNHHERLDGSGYPDGLRGDAIPLLVQIINLVDTYDALTTTRPYKAAYEPDRAFEELRDEARRGWRRADLVDALVATPVH